MENQGNYGTNNQPNMGNGYYQQNNVQNGYYQQNNVQNGQYQQNNMGNGYYQPNMQGQYYNNNMQYGYNQQNNMRAKKNIFAILSIIFAGIGILLALFFMVITANDIGISSRISSRDAAVNYFFGTAFFSILRVLVTFPMCIAGITLGILGVVKADKYIKAQTYKIMAIAGIVLGGIGLLLTVTRF